LKLRDFNYLNEGDNNQKVDYPGCLAYFLRTHEIVSHFREA